MWTQKGIQFVSQKAYSFVTVSTSDLGIADREGCRGHSRAPEERVVV